jgi:gliding motility-associated-like protein
MNLPLRKSLLSFVCLLISHFIIAQNKQVNHWYFGNNISLNFNTSLPTIAINGLIEQLEGSATISDENGQLLFYTDGLTVWNKQHNSMANGTGLLGDPSSSQSALIIPKPGSKSVFYIFTAPAWGDYLNYGIRYSVVDLNLNNGLGGIVPNQKNISLQAPATEKLAAIHHSNGKDIWVVSSQYNTNKYYAYLVTEEGVCNCPIISQVGQIQSQYQGYLKFSPDGTKLVSAQATEDVELFNFDACTGSISYYNNIPKTTGYYPFQSHFYGASFSPDNSKLYLSTGWWGFYGCAKLYQYDMNASDIAKSQILLYDNIVSSDDSNCATFGVGAIQMGPDFKIYVANWRYGYLHVINKPNELGSKANFVKDGLYLGGRLGELGLPNFIESYFTTSSTQQTCSPSTITADFSYRDTCQLQLTHFVDLSRASPESLLCYNWNFGDPASGNNNISDLASPTHIFSIPGAYQVTLTVSSGTACKLATITKKVTILPLPKVDLGADQRLCLRDSIRLDVKLPGATYLWQDQSTTASFTVTKPGIYWVEVTQGRCTTRDSIKIEYVTPPTIHLGKDTVLCIGATLTLVASNPDQALQYEWQDGTTTPTYLVKEAGTYWVELSNAFCKARDTIQVTYDSPQEIDLGEDVIVCLGEQYTVSVPLYPNMSYVWSDQTTKQEMIIDKVGTYWLAYKTTGTACLKSDTIRIYYKECLDDLRIPNVLTPNGDGRNETFEIMGAKGTTWNLVIFNRWGVKVGNYEDYQNDWNAAGLDNALYFYTLISQQSGKIFKGWVQVLR